MPWSFLSSRTGAGTSVGTLPRGRPGCPLLGLHASSFASFACRHPRENFLLEPSHRPGQACEASRRGSLQQPRRGPQGSCPFSAADWRTHWPCLARELLPGPPAGSSSAPCLPRPTLRPPAGVAASRHPGASQGQGRERFIDSTSRHPEHLEHRAPAFVCYDCAPQAGGINNRKPLSQVWGPSLRPRCDRLGSLLAALPGLQMAARSPPLPVIVPLRTAPGAVSKLPLPGGDTRQIGFGPPESLVLTPSPI